MAQQTHVFEQRARGKTSSLRYLLYLPDDYAAEGEDLWPLLLFLHGAGERGDDLNQVKAHGPPKLIAQGRRFPFLVVSPQCPRGQYWAAPLLSGLLDEVTASYRVDPDRIYLTGISMGAFGAWELAISEPDRFAAFVPICGGGDPELVCNVKHVPIWVVHGARDDVVPLEASEMMVEALREYEGKVRFTVYPEAGHDSWTQTYANPKLYEWLLAQRRVPRDDEDDAG